MENIFFLIIVLNMKKKNMVKKDCSATTNVLLSIYDIIKLHPGLRKLAGVADRQTDLKTFKKFPWWNLKVFFGQNSQLLLLFNHCGLG